MQQWEPQRAGVSVCMCVWWVRGTSGFTNNHCFHVDKVKVLTTGEAAWLTAGSANRSLVTSDQLFTD